MFEKDIFICVCVCVFVEYKTLKEVNSFEEYTFFLKEIIINIHV